MIRPTHPVKITAELQKKLEKDPLSFPFVKRHNYGYVSSFFHYTPPPNKPVRLVPSSWKWNDPSYVRIPLSSDYHHPKNPLLPNWKLIEETLSQLNLKISNGGAPDDEEHIRHIFRKTISKYNFDAVSSSRFLVILNDACSTPTNLAQMLWSTLPSIIDLALQLPCLIQGPIPILKRGNSQTIYLTRDLVASLLANAFLSTFPDQRPSSSLPSFKFNTLFNEEIGSHVKTQVKREKLKCLLNYFAQMDQSPRRAPNTIISYERRCVPFQYDWASSNKQLCGMRVTSGYRKIEENEDMLQVDFANKVVGGGVLDRGAAQEEIRFVTSPELICARLFTQPLGDDEVLVVTGTGTFSKYSGYGERFRWGGGGFGGNSKVDYLGREVCQVVAMDALDLKGEQDGRGQYGEDMLRRELHKCYVAFIPGRHVTPVATGFWGCGCFGGDPEWKFLVQWMAASVHSREVIFCPGGRGEEGEKYRRMGKLLEGRKVGVAGLFGVLKGYLGKCVELRPRRRRRSVFQFVERKVM